MTSKRDGPPLMIPLINIEEFSFSSKKICVIRDINQKCLNKNGEWENLSSFDLWNNKIPKQFRFKSIRDASKFWSRYEDKRR